MRRSPSDDPDRLTQAEVEAALRQLEDNPANMARAKSLARLRAAGLDDCSPKDLLQETMVSLLLGNRRWPRGVHTLVVLKTAMHGVASNLRKRSDKGAINRRIEVDVAEDDGAETAAAVKTVTATEDVTPVEIANSKSELEAIQQAVAGDDEMELVLMAWADGLRGKEAVEALGFEMKTYEAARKRLIRKLGPIEALRKQS